MCKSIFSCPVCGNELEIAGRTYKCKKNHCFDMAKSGYVNLLTSDRMNSKLPGDNKLMVRARREFLSRGYYANLADTLSSLVCKYSGNNVTMLDAGSGEGYYTEKVGEALLEKGVSLMAGGFDISKNAADFAAKSGKNNIEYSAASVFHMPVSDRSINVLLSVFSPFCAEEFLRVLADDGLLFMVIPDKRHLWELKCVLYETPYENQVKDYALDGFELLEAADVPERKIFLETREDIVSLFTMTPYYYNTRPEDKQKLEKLDSLETTTSFKILIYRKKGE